MNQQNSLSKFSGALCSQSVELIKDSNFVKSAKHRKFYAILGNSTRIVLLLN